MMELVELFGEGLVVPFILLFSRFSALFLFTPIFSHANIPMNVKASMALFFTIFFYGSLPPINFEINSINIIIAILGEMLLGAIVGLILQLAYNVITFAGGIISFMMGFSLASAIDPQTGVSMPIVSQFLALLALMMLLTFDMHHWILMFVNTSISAIPLGGFMISENIFKYLLDAMANLFVVGFMIAFPITALQLLADVIFGMLMKTMPQFNLLVIGMPIKIAVSLLVITAILASTLMIVVSQVESAYKYLERLLW